MLSMPPEARSRPSPPDDVVGQHWWPSCRAADLVTVWRRGIRQFGATRGLSGRGLALSGRQYVA